MSNKILFRIPGYVRQALSAVLIPLCWVCAHVSNNSRTKVGWMSNKICPRLSNQHCKNTPNLYFRHISLLSPAHFQTLHQWFSIAMWYFIIRATFQGIQIILEIIKMITTRPRKKAPAAKIQIVWEPKNIYRKHVSIWYNNFRYCFDWAWVVNDRFLTLTTCSVNRIIVRICKITVHQTCRTPWFKQNQ